MKSSYRDSGVDIQAGRDAVAIIKNIVKETFSPNVLTDIGSFGGCFEFPVKQFRQPVLVSSTDGVGTKLMIATLMERYNTVGQCLVNHCVNDILTTGAQPLFFLDYIGLGKLEPSIVTEIVQGLATACKENNCALIGGEMAEMPGIYQQKDFELVGTITGVAEKNRLLPRNIQAGDILIGLQSSGLHTNGYSLARSVLLKHHALSDYIEELDAVLGDLLLNVHRSYLPIIKDLLDNDDLHGISHITGGGIEGNTSRILPDGLKLDIDWDSWEWLPVFSYIQRLGNVDTEEMRQVFNLGIGLILIVDSSAQNSILNILRDKGEKPTVIGLIK
ncbi:phosphoribosylformylglycinamidine cyclo-ligase [bacterium]|nr:phosphoribosylformylglycinamidine cyclo-ligase [bacterium]MBU1633959.1 phosphoribosylformylglycinamidine cyclo-ligase [bacterium]MBU1875189.1 phosphoribosylformylglycinamidine cyclo-ligase [bacterium]